MLLVKRDCPGVNYIVVLIGIASCSFWLGCSWLFTPVQAQGMMEVAGKVRGVLSKSRTALGIAAKFVPCFKLVSEIQDNMKKVGYNTKGLKLCLEKAIPKDEEIQGRENQDITKDELRNKVKNCITSMIAAARGKDDVEEDMLTDVKDCFMTAAQSLSALTNDDDAGAGGGSH